MAAISPLILRTSALASSLRRRSHAPMSWARRRTDRVRSRNFVRDASPAALIAAVNAASCATPLASRPESVGYATSASTTVVSARTLSRRTSLSSWALASSASFSPSIASDPQRDVIFINVVGCGTRDPSGTRQNRRHASESATSAHNGSNPSR